MGSIKVIKGGTIIDGTETNPIRDSIVVIDGTKISISWWEKGYKNS